MHSGNVGHAQRPRQPRPRDDLSSRSRTISPSRSSASALAMRRSRELARRLDADKILFLPYQPREMLSQSLGSAHVHYVGLAKGLSGFVVPSRLYGILASGRPVIVAADADSETASLVEEVGLRRRDSAGPARLAGGGRSATPTTGGSTSRRWAARGREYVEREADRSVALARYRSLIDSFCTRREDPPGHAVLRSCVGVRRAAARDARLRSGARRAWSRSGRLHDGRARPARARRRRRSRRSTVCASAASRTSSNELAWRTKKYLPRGLLAALLRSARQLRRAARHRHADVSSRRRPTSRGRARGPDSSSRPSARCRARKASAGR